MKIEKVNDHQIRCTLTKADLADRELKISELAYGTEKAKSLFRDMMQQASVELGFEAEDIPLMIEAIPVSGDCIVLVITKVEDPEELDTRFSRFAPSMDEIDADESSEDDSIAPSSPSTSDLLDLFNQLKQDIKNAVEGNGDNFIPFPQGLTKKKTDANNSSTPKVVKKEISDKDSAPKHILKIFSFTNLDSLIDVSCRLREMYNGANSLYKCEENNLYYLVINKGNGSVEDFNKVCNILTEYGSMVRSTSANEAYFKEHFKKIIAKKAIQKLAMADINQ